MGNAADYIPALRYGHKIMPEHLASMLGLPRVGSIFYVDPATGSDNGGGKTFEDAFATVGAAYSAMAADNDDVVVICGTSSTGRTTETAAITWAKRRTHIVGNGPARWMNARNGMNLYASNTASAFKITANNCSFTNISFAAFGDTDVAVELSSVSYTTFNNCHFQGIANATPAGETGARSVLITSSGENEFNNCTIGVDTVTRTAANASLELTGSCPRNMFKHCLFPMYTSSADALWVKADTGNCFERFLIFEDCMFTNATLGSSTVITIGMDLSATGNGQVYMRNSRWYGATDLTNTVTDVLQDSPTFDTNDQGVMTVHANS